ncbi:MAG: ABC transporter permease [Acidobacteriaceae bacterium]|nr:ABC transporter permease [Acidobacteriaceae bacterium]MBV9499476.1 ABC transporter permease [Acidobacteriaceae bacterium]
MNSLVRDIRYAIRVLRKSPVATAVGVIALALGIGVNASIFITVSALILHPLAYPHLERIVTIWETPPKLHDQKSSFAPANFNDLKNETHSFQKLAAYRGWDASLTSTVTPERVRAMLVSPSFFSVLGSSAEMGRVFAADEDQPSRSRVAVLSEGFWKSHLGGSSSAIGQPITLDGLAYTVIGVMPDSFDYPLGTQVWTPMTLEAAAEGERDLHSLMVLGLLKPGVSAAEAGAEAATLASRLAHEYPKTNQDRSMLVLPLRDLIDQVTSHFVITLVGAAGFVLLLACANIGNLQLARATNREREIAVRAALGASRFEIARQLFTESILISAAAGVVGLLLASWNNTLMKTRIPPIALREVPGLRTMHVDSTVVVLTVVASLIAGILCGLPMISQVVNRRMCADLNDVLRGRGGSTSTTPARNRLRTALVIFELTLALVLLVGAGLMVKTFDRLLYLNQGFDSKNLLTMQVSLPATQYRDAAQSRRFYDRALEGLGTIRGVTSAALSSSIGSAERFAIEGQPEPRPADPHPEVIAVSARYFAAMRIPVLEGRSISDTDRRGSPPVAVISGNVARHYWPKADPIGQKIRLDAQSGWLTVVGVAGNVVEDWFTNQPAPVAYISYAQFPAPQTMFLLRTSGDPMQAASPARFAIRRVDKDLPVYEVKTMEQSMSEERGGVRAAAQSMTTYAVIALLLAASGIYAMISYFVAARTHDIGVHMALGANRNDVLRMTMGQSLRLTVTGLAFGIPLSMLLAHVMASALYNVVNIDGTTFAIYTGVLFLSALLASYLPSLRATHIDPMTALREE